MIFQSRPVAGILAIFLCLQFMAAKVRADDDSARGSTNSIPADSHPGLFNWLDPRSAYNREFFPQPLLVDDTSLESEGELEFNYLHTGAHAQRTDLGSVEVQKSFGLLTLELAAPYERIADADDSARGVGNIDAGARYPIYQFVSARGFFDTTLGVALEAGIPVESALSKNAELTPTVFNDLKLGDHVSLQTVLDYSATFGPGDGGGLKTFEYGFVAAYELGQKQLPLPGLVSLSPMLEIAGETGLNRGQSGQNSLLGSLGFRAICKPIGELQPSLGLGYVFPVDNGARSEVHWGIAASLIFEF